MEVFVVSGFINFFLGLLAFFYVCLVIASAIYLAKVQRYLRETYGTHEDAEYTPDYRVASAE
jgi:hypothetical protein